MDEDAHARSARNSDKLFQRPRGRHPSLVSAPHRVRRPLLPAMLAALLGGAGARTGTLPGALLCLMALLQLLCSAPRGSGLAHGRRLICWQALLQCQGEPDCSYAYSQYAEACALALPEPLHLGAYPAQPHAPRARAGGLRLRAGRTLQVHQARHRALSAAHQQRGPGRGSGLGHGLH